jgi:hypothetical protein
MNVLREHTASVFIVARNKHEAVSKQSTACVLQCLKMESVCSSKTLLSFFRLHVMSQKIHQPQVQQKSNNSLFVYFLLLCFRD